MGRFSEVSQGVSSAVAKTPVEMALLEIQGQGLQQSGAYVLDEGGSKVAAVWEESALGEAHKRRIVAAVNACAGISLEDLRMLGTGGLASVLKRVRGRGLEEGADAVSVTFGRRTESDAQGGTTKLKTVHVVAWVSASGGGFNWYEEGSDADEAYREEQRNCSDMRDSLWTAYRFDIQVDRWLMRDEISVLLQTQIHELCASSKQRFAVGRGMAGVLA